MAAVPPNATLIIDLELLSWKSVEDVTDDKRVVKKILKAGEGYDKPNDGATVQGWLIDFAVLLHHCQLCDANEALMEPY